MASQDASEPFPPLDGTDNTAPRTSQEQNGTTRPRKSSITSSIGNRSRRAGSSIASAFMNSNPPLGMWQAAGEVAAKVPTMGEIRSGGFSAEGWTHEGQMEHRGVNPHEIHAMRKARTSSTSTGRRGSIRTPKTPGTIEESIEYFPHVDRSEQAARVPTTIQEGALQAGIEVNEKRGPSKSFTSSKDDIVAQADLAPSTSSGDQPAEPYEVGPDETGTYPNGYRFPKKHNWRQSTGIGLRAFWKFFLTPFGFLITIYGLNVVAWGAMIFFVLLDAAPALCHPSCNALSSARKKWIEIDSQILNGLFCVTGFGLIPWRFRDFYFLMRWRVWGDQYAFRRLAGINRSWFRLPGSDHLADDIGPPPVYDKKHPMKEDAVPPYSQEEILAMERNPAIPMPVTSMPEPPLTGVRAKPTKPHKLDIVIWMYLWNTIFQAALAGCMWGFNRFNRPSATTGIFITAGCIVAIYAGLTAFFEGKKVKAVEGIPVHEYDVFETIEEHQAAEEKKHAKDKKHHKDEKAEQKHERSVSRLSKNNKKETRRSREAGMKEKSAEGAPEIQIQGRPGMGNRTHTRTEKVKGHEWFTRH